MRCSAFLRQLEKYAHPHFRPHDPIFGSRRFEDYCLIDVTNVSRGKRETEINTGSMSLMDGQLNAEIPINQHSYLDYFSRLKTCGCDVQRHLHEPFVHAHTNCAPTKVGCAVKQLLKEP